MKPLLEVVGDLSIVVRSPRTARVYGIAFDAVDGDEEITVTELDDDAPYRAEDWPITHDAGPIVCGLCRQELTGAGYGVVSALLRVVDDHIPTCPERPNASGHSGANPDAAPRRLGAAATPESTQHHTNRSSR